MDKRCIMCVLSQVAGARKLAHQEPECQATWPAINRSPFKTAPSSASISLGVQESNSLLSALASKPVPNSQSLTCDLAPILTLEQRIVFSTLALATSQLPLAVLTFGRSVSQPGLLLFDGDKVPKHASRQFGALANIAMSPNDAFLDTGLLAHPCALANQAVRADLRRRRNGSTVFGVRGAPRSGCLHWSRVGC